MTISLIIDYDVFEMFVMVFWIIDGCSYFGIDNMLITHITLDWICIGDCLGAIYFDMGVVFAIDNALAIRVCSADMANSFAIMIAEKRTVLQEIDITA